MKKLPSVSLAISLAVSLISLSLGDAWANTGNAGASPSMDKINSAVQTSLTGYSSSGKAAAALDYDFSKVTANTNPNTIAKAMGDKTSIPAGANGDFDLHYKDTGEESENQQETSTERRSNSDVKTEEDVDVHLVMKDGKIEGITAVRRSGIQVVSSSEGMTDSSMRFSDTTLTNACFSNCPVVNQDLAKTLPKTTSTTTSTSKPPTTIPVTNTGTTGNNNPTQLATATGNSCNSSVSPSSPACTTK